MDKEKENKIHNNNTKTIENVIYIREQYGYGKSHCTRAA